MKILNFVLMAAILIAFAACEKESYNKQAQELPTSKAKTVEIGEPTVEHGMLVFENHESFKSMAQRLDKLDRANFEKWEKDVGFESQQSIFTKIVRAEMDLDIPYANMTQEQLKNVIPPAEHSQFYDEMLKEGLIKEIPRADGSTTYDYNMIDGSLAKLLNKKGCLKIADSIFCFKGNFVKVITDGDFNKLSLLENKSVSDPQNNIIIYNEGLKLKTNANPPSNTVTSGKKRITLTVSFNFKEYSIFGDYMLYAHNVNVLSEFKNWLGKWKQDGDVYLASLTGNWTLRNRYRYVDDTFADEDVSHSYTQSELPATGWSNVWVSVNPGSDDSTAPFESWFYIYKSDNPLIAIWEETSYINYQWTAVRDGGCCGLYANVPAN